MAHDEAKASPSMSGFLPEDDGTAEAGPVETNNSIQMAMDVKEFESVSVDGGKVETLMEEPISQPNMNLDSRNDENKITEKNNEENVVDVATYEGENVTKEVHNGEYVAEMATGDGEDILKEEGKLTCVIGGAAHEQNTEKNNEEDAEANHEDVLKEEHPAKEVDEEALCMRIPEQVEDNKLGNEENNIERVEKSSVQRLIKSRKRKRGKMRAKNSFKKFASEGKNKNKVPSNGEEDADIEGDALIKDDNTREDITKRDNSEENEENNKEKIEDGLKQKFTKSRKRKMGNGRKRLEKMALENVASEGGGEMCPKKVTSNGEDKEDQGFQKGVSKTEALLGSKNLAPQGKDVAESSHGKKSLKKAKKVEGMGLIFMCNSETKKDCYRYNILGLPASKREMVENVYKGMRLFLYDVDLKLLYGIYKAAGPGGYNIEPKAFKSQYPSQVRFMVLDDCKPLAEEKFKAAIKKNYYTRNKFNCKLSSEQVKDLCKLFTATSRTSISKKLGRHPKKESKRVAEQDRVERDRTRKHGVDRASRHLKAESKRGVDRDLIRRFGVNKRDRRRSPLMDHRYHEYSHSHQYEKDVAALVAQGSRLIPLRPLTSAPTYVYDRPLETDAYIRGPLLIHGDSYRRDIMQEPQDDAYKPDVLIDHRRYYRQDPISELHNSYRHDDGIVYQHEIANYDRHASYRERLPHGGPVYRNVSPAGLSAEYYSGDRSAEYRSAGASLPEYHVTSRSRPEYLHGGLRPEYQSSVGMRRYPY